MYGTNSKTSRCPVWNRRRPFPAEPPSKRGADMKNHRRQMRGITLNSLKDELYSLNMRMLLAMQAHDGEELERLKKESEEVREKIGRLCSGSLLPRP